MFPMTILDDLLSRKLTTSRIPLPKGNISLDILRMDKIHPVISGNKIFKLYYFLNDALKSSEKRLVTFGGTYSNHLAATAFAAAALGLYSSGFVRGEEPAKLSHTLRFCLEQGMELYFLSRAQYKLASQVNIPESPQHDTQADIIIREGGFSEKGAEGAALIHEMADLTSYTHICVAMGTATTLSGILRRTGKQQQVLAFPALKGMNDIDQRLADLKTPAGAQYNVFSAYHFGEFAKINTELINFMNRFYRNYEIPLDRVYTAKMMFGVFDLIEKKYFPPGSKILCLHTGGLQGNDSLPSGTLFYGDHFK